MPRDIRTRSTFVLTGLAVVFAAVAAILAARGYEQRLDQVRHTVDVQRRLMIVLSTIQDAETGQRGYLLTGDPVYLKPYQGARQRLESELGALDALVADNELQGAAAQGLRPLMAAKFDELERTVALRGAGQTEAALAIVHRDEGRRTMERIRRQIAGMADREGELLRERSAASRAYSYGLFGFLMLLAASAIGGLIAWLLQSRRDARALAIAHRSAVEANENLRIEAAERSSAEEQVRQLQKMEAIGQLTGGIAHDFNNMLAVIMGNIELARRNADDRAKLDLRLAGAQDGAVKAATLTKRLLAFSRRQPLEPQTLDLNKLVSGMSDMLLRALGEDVEVETVLSGGLWKTYADPTQVESAILNLVVNARDAMPGGGRLTIETSNGHLDDDYARKHPDAKAGQYAVISVSDTGVGMSPEVAAKAFEPFFTTKAVGKGTGLGLSQIYGFAKQTGGHARIYSEPGGGATVKLYLPRDFRSAGESQAPDEAANPPLSGSPDKIILVVEDEDTLRRLSVESLRSLGYSVRHAADGETALRILNELGSVDLLFTDIVMPGMNGRQLADAASEIRPDLKVLYTTGYTHNAVVHNGVLDPGVALLSKPFTLDQLAAKVQAVLKV